MHMIVRHRISKSGLTMRQGLAFSLTCSNAHRNAPKACCRGRPNQPSTEQKYLDPPNENEKGPPLQMVGSVRLLITITL